MILHIVNLGKTPDYAKLLGNKMLEPEDTLNTAQFLLLTTDLNQVVNSERFKNIKDSH